MRTTFHFGEEPQTFEVRVVHAPHLEDSVRTNLDTIPLAFAFPAVDDRHVHRWLCATLFARTLGMFGRATGLFFVEAFLAHPREDTTARRIHQANLYVVRHDERAGGVALLQGVGKSTLSRAARSKLRRRLHMHMHEGA